MKAQALAEKSQKKCTLGCEILDRCLGGGVPCSSITELVSENGCGKTQICLQLLLSVQLPPSHGGLHASSLYLYSESSFPLRRLLHLSRYLPLPFLRRENHLLDHVFVEPLHSADHLLHVLSKLDSFLFKTRGIRHPIKLIVIDSIAALFRSDFDCTSFDLGHRSSLFLKISGKLRLLADKFELVVVVTNQVVDYVEKSSYVRVGNLPLLFTSGRMVVPALGLTWANCVNTRLFLSKSEEGIVSEDHSSSKQRRRIHVLFSPHLPPSSSEFVILREGVFGVEN